MAIDTLQFVRGPDGSVNRVLFTDRRSLLRTLALLDKVKPEDRSDDDMVVWRWKRGEDRNTVDARTAAVLALGEEVLARGNANPGKVVEVGPRDELLTACRVADNVVG